MSTEKIDVLGERSLRYPSKNIDNTGRTETKVQPSDKYSSRIMHD